jgi:ethanolamine-phosphate cytidylyltransferase
VLGVHSDEQITLNKGPPVMNESERYALARECKWVDEVVEDAPFTPTPEFLDQVNCYYGVHGDDVTPNSTGVDAYQTLRDAKRLKIIKRTEGISTTALVGKLLLMTRDHHQENVDQPLLSR